MVDIKEKRQLSVLPKIMYVPAERNFLTVVKNAYDVTNIPATLKTFGEELKKSMFSLNGKMLELPIGNDKIKYDKSKDKIFLVLNDLDLEISDSSSGYQSLVPLYAVTKYLCDEINKNRGELPIKLSINQSLRRQEQLDSINSDLSLSNEVKQERIRDINKKFFPSCLVNIVEEPEQNLFPNSQQQILNSLLEFNNMNSENKLIITTHSPYLINYLTLAVKAEMVKLKLNTNSSKKKLAEIVPLDATLCAENLVIYELNEKDGTIKKLSDYKGLPSDKNYLNSGLEDLNELFAQLQEIEKGWR